MTKPLRAVDNFYKRRILDGMNKDDAQRIINAVRMDIRRDSGKVIASPALVAEVAYMEDNEHDN